MHRDKKLGLALGVLLVGIVAAMFFRLDTSKRDFFPHLKSSRELDDRIAERRFTTYPGDFDGDDDDDEDNAKPPTKLVEPPLWEMPAFLADDDAKSGEKAPEDWLAKTPAAPDPIVADVHDLDMFDSGSFHGTPVPQHNQAWMVSDTKVRNPPSAGQWQGTRTHRIRSGDTLSGLAAYYLGSSARYNEIYNLNRDVLRSPHDLKIGVELKIPTGVRPAAPEKPNESIFHNADGQHVVEPGGNKTGPVLVSPSSLQNSIDNGITKQPAAPPASRFVPAGRPPFTPGRRDDRTTQNSGGTSKNTLSQIPPSDLPEVD